MFDTHAIVGIDVKALATKADLRAEITALEARLAWRLIGAGIAIAGIQTAALFTLLRLIG